jgi:hypothetical protein
MATQKHTEYLNPLGSMDRNTTRRAYLAPGRYHGFDTLEVDTGNDIHLSHTDPLQYVNASNALVSVAAFVDGHGMVMTTDVEPSFTWAANSGDDNTYQILFAQYTWANSALPASISYGIGSVKTTEPIVASGLTPVQTALGYITIPPGAAGGDLIYTPYATPNLAGKPDVDLSGYATLAGPNKFTGLNALNATVLPKSAVVVDPTLGAPWYNLYLSEDANIFTIEGLDSGQYNIQNIYFSGSRTAQDGEVFYIRFANSAAAIKWYSGNLRVPSAVSEVYLDLGALFMFIRQDSLYQAYSMPTSYLEVIESIGNRVTTNESQLQEHTDQLAALSSGPIWEDVVAMGTVSGQWTINSLKKTTKDGFTYLSGRFTSDTAGMVAGSSEITSQVLGADSTIPAMQDSGSTGYTGVTNLLGVRLNSGDDTIKLVHPVLPGGIAYQFTLPPTIIS